MQQWLKLAEDSDHRPVHDGLDLPAEIARRDKRLAGIAQAKTKIEQRARERHAVEQQEYEAKCDKWQGQCDEGKKPRGPDPKPPSSEPKAGDQVKLSDEASRIMQSSRGGFEQSYNAQAAVDTQTMRVVATKAGRGLYRLRKQTAAPVFGIIKRVMGWSQLNMGGLDNARGEWLLGACRAWGVESEKRPQRGQFLPDLQAHSSTMGQKAGEKWAAEAVSQPTIRKSDRLPEVEKVVDVIVTRGRVGSAQRASDKPPSQAIVCPAM